MNQPAKAKTTTRKKIALVLLLGPTALIFACFILFAISNLAGLGTGFFSEGQQQSVLSIIVNVTTFIFAVIGVISWLPALITGIVLLATTKK